MTGQGQSVGKAVGDGDRAENGSRKKSSGRKFRIGDESVVPQQGKEMGRGMAVG